MLEASIGTDNDDALTEVACGVVGRHLADSSPNGAGGLPERGSDSERAGVGKVGGGTARLGGGTLKSVTGGGCAAIGGDGSGTGVEN